MRPEEIPLLRIPGPTPLPPNVREVMSRQMINHRGSEYGELQRSVIANLQHFFQTESDVLLFCASGTGGLEAAIVNTLSPGDAVLAVSIGVFGDRFAAIASAYGLDVRRYSVPQGEGATVSGLMQRLNEHGDARAILMTCNETSTGVANDMHALVAAIRAVAPNILVLADAVSALGAVDLPMDLLDLDVVVTGSQKAWMAPPGIAMIGVSERAWNAHRSARLPRHYWDFTTQRKAQTKHMDAWTPAMTTMFALHESLGMMREEGRERIYARHARIAEHTRDKLVSAGLTLFAREWCRSNTVTSAAVPTDIDGKALLRSVRERHGVVLGGGQGMLEGQIVRIGHMGWVHETHIDAAIDALADCLDLSSHPDVPVPFKARVSYG